ncbi:hypothetical protein [Bacillus mobilis]|uniref:hypothetical protein n=1 Tax=Bacillus mobilis TaxID=2026190 RepID=UPI0022E28F3F|nr:hypothetical protein [Bacillus mobilis]
MNSTISEIELKVIELHNNGLGYKRIAGELGFNRDKARYLCKKLGLVGVRGEIKPKAHPKEKPKKYCIVCNAQLEKGKSKYCSVKCRKTNNKEYVQSCKRCGDKFKSAFKKLYCSEQCRQSITYDKCCNYCKNEFRTKDKDKQYCSGKCRNSDHKKSHEEFVTQLIKVHRGLIVPLEMYKGSDYEIKAKCLKCGTEMKKIARAFIGTNSTGCNSCGNRSTGNNTIERWLIDNNYEYIKEYSADDLIYFSKLFFDFAIINNGILTYLIEFDGIQHFKSIKSWGGEEKFNENIIRDEIKNNYANEKNIPLLRISYKEKKNITDILNNRLLGAPIS